MAASFGALALLAAGCGEEFDRTAAVESFQRANPEISATQAECVVDRQIGRYGIDGLATELQADPESDEFIDQQFRDMFACGIDGDITEQLIDQLQSNGVAADDAPCVAGALTGDLDDADIDVLVSGEITDEFMAKFVSAMESCGATGNGG